MTRVTPQPTGPDPGVGAPGDGRTTDSGEATLSAHLLREAARFLPYPTRVSRTPTNIGAQKIVQEFFRKLAEWRRTFSPVEGRDLVEGLTTKPVLLDDLFSREMLQAVPGMVERTRGLSTLVLSDVPEGDSFVYLREAANCYLFGLGSAAVALTRAAVEESLRKRCSERFGRRQASPAKLHQLIEDAAKARLFSGEGLARGHRIQAAANRVLHEEPIESHEALAVIEDGRKLILELSHVRRSSTRASRKGP
jgi:hypothetical protein